MVRVLIAEDSVVTREYLVRLLEEDAEIEVAGAARNGAEAIEKAARLQPDVILMDVFMPGLDGYEATRQIMQRIPTPIVMISTGFDRQGMATTFEALNAGAVAVVEKPGGRDHPDDAESRRQLVETVKLMAGVRVVRRWPKRTGPASGPPAPSPAYPNGPPYATHRARIRVVAIGASTGGPAALADILGELPAGLSVPILIVQHIARGFAAGLAAWLDGHAHLPVKLAAPGEQARPGSVYLAPDDCHLSITRDGLIRLTRDAVEGGFRPSISYLFRSVAEAYGPAAIGVLLTGMGQDGVGGLSELRRARGVTIAQDKESSVVFGMPAKAIHLGAAEYVLPPRGIAEMIRTLDERAGKGIGRE